MKNFLSCDWGTSFFRLRYVQVPGLQFESVETSDGIAVTFEAWKQKQNESGKQSGSEGRNERFLFFRNVIAGHLQLLEEDVGISLKGIPLVISGMASSSIGMMEIPYKQAPLRADGSDLEVVTVKRSKDFDHDIFIISGIKTADDVLRGEETQLAGCWKPADKEQLYIFPGTHSKHILVKKGSAINFKTYMTGEFFELLSRKSILASSVRSGGELSVKANRKAFNDGVKEAQRSSLLHASFLVRTNQLLKEMDPVNNYYYLSGLLIGTELCGCAESKPTPIILVAPGELKQLYLSAFKILGLKNNVRSTDSTLALLRGQLKILKNAYRWNSTKN